VRRIEARRPRQDASPRAEPRARVPETETEVAALLDVRFPAAIRGYDRDHVDRYITRVNQVLAELQITKTPETAVKRALEEVSREKQAVIEEAHQAAEEITARSRSRADDRIQEATQEAEKLREEAAQGASDLRSAAERDAQATREAAEQRVRELEAQIEGMIEKRERVIEELAELARSLDGVVEAKGGDAAASPVAAHADGAG
jgi:DivIVA domain-containing protein